ncbi:hypothetical protein MUNTM_34130 [Mycobacterium sp. MUNTM1]
MSGGIHARDDDTGCRGDRCCAPRAVGFRQIARDNDIGRPAAASPFNGTHKVRERNDFRECLELRGTRILAPE